MHSQRLDLSSTLPVTWEVDIPLVTNPRLLKTLALVAGLATLIPSLLLSLILGAQGD